jgi:hypothetical protein
MIDPSLTVHPLHPRLPNRLRNLFWTLQKITRNMLHLPPLLLRQQRHHFLWRRPARNGEDLGPAVRGIEEGAQRVEARYAICAGNHSGEVCERGVELGEVVVYSAVAEGVIL